MIDHGDGALQRAVHLQETGLAHRFEEENMHSNRTGPYGFRPATLTDLPMLRAWKAAPHVAAWWGESDPFDVDDLATPGFQPWIVSFAGRDFAYLQDYDPGIEADHHFGHLPAGSRGIDQFIGPADMLGQGHGTAIVAQHVAFLFSLGVPVVALDPHPGNARAIRVYEKAGFRVAGPAQETRWGPILPMVIERQPPPGPVGDQDSPSRFIRR